MSHRVMDAANMPCGKASYPTRAAIRRQLGRYHIHWRVYYCQGCDALHVTHARRPR